MGSDGDAVSDGNGNGNAYDHSEEEDDTCVNECEQAPGREATEKMREIWIKRRRENVVQGM